MTDDIAGLPFWQITFDAEGDPDGAGREALLTETAARHITDLFVFSHGGNNEPRIARLLYDGFFGLLAGQLPPGRRGDVGLAGVFWLSRRWSDEPIPDFTPAAPMAASGAAGGARPGRPPPGGAPPPPPPATAHPRR